jgi:Ran GTPase-activating protein (RanGAP) involved in mRNA processing and transport
MINAKLPQSNADYFQAANAHITDAVVATFAEDALVTDESREHRGAAFREWGDEVNEKYKPHTEVTGVAEADEKTVVTADDQRQLSRKSGPTPLQFHTQGRQDFRAAHQR